MEESLRFLVEHGYWFLGLWVLLDQVGLPIPAFPVLLGSGALAGAGQLDLGAAIAVATTASLPSDLLWFELGRRRGIGVLRLLCRIAIEPDSCVRSSERVFARWGAGSLVLAKFVPGLQVVAPPLAGVFRLSRSRFLLLDGAAALLWSGAFIGLGYAFHDQLEQVALVGLELGARLLFLMGLAIGIYLLAKLVNRQHVLRSLRMARITPEELKRRLDAGEEIQIVDLRHPLDFAARPGMLPGARRISAEEVQARHHEISRERELVLYCT